MMHPLPRTSRQHGFTLVELSVVLVIIGLIIGTGVSMGKSAMESAYKVSTNNRMDAIETALAAYRMANNRLPCPGNLLLTETSADFGKEAANPGLCRESTPTSNFYLEPNSVTPRSLMVEGSVPVRALNLPDSFAYDGYGNKISYGVWSLATSTNAFLSYGIRQNCGNITVKNSGGRNRTSTALYALVSFGKDGHGAYNAAGAKVNAGSINSNEQLNCHCGTNGNDSGYAATYVQGDTTEDPSNSHNNFDDIVRYKERWQMSTVNDKYTPDGTQTCPGTGFRIDGGTNTGWTQAAADIDGDGIDDLIIAISGKIYVIYGKSTGFANPLDLIATANGTDGFVIDTSGVPMQRPAKIVKGNIAHHTGPNALKQDIVFSYNKIVYTIFAQDRSFWSANNFTLKSNPSTDLIDGVHGFSLLPPSSTYNYGTDVAVGDVNNDGVDDIIIGSPSNTSFYNSAGEVEVVFGGTCSASSLHAGTCASGWPSGGQTINSGFFDGTFGSGGVRNGFVINDPSPGLSRSGSFGYTVAVGNLHRAGPLAPTDTLRDIIIAAPWATVTVGGTPTDLTGSIYVIFGSTGFANPLDVSGSFFNGTNGFQINGGPIASITGMRLATGDFNGDGVDDLYISGGVTSNIIFGKSTPWTTTPLIALNTPFVTGAVMDNGMMIENVPQLSDVSIGDINNDGVVDLVLGLTNAREVDVIFGARAVSGVPKKYDGNNWPVDSQLYSLIDGVNGFKLASSVTNDQFGTSVVTGDVNGDGKKDIIAGEPKWGQGAVPGNIYVFFGQTKVGWQNPYNISNVCLGAGC